MPSKSEDSLRKLIRDWWKSRLDGVDEIDIKTESQRGAMAFRQDEAFVERFLDEFLKDVVLDVGRNLLTQRRSQTTYDMRTMSNQEVADALAASPSDWSRWMEHEPQSGRHISLFKMTKEQALSSAAEREKRIEPDLHRVALIRLAAGRLKPGQMIGDVWSADELADVESRICIGKPRISLGPVGMLKTMKEAAA